MSAYTINLRMVSLAAAVLGVAAVAHARDHITIGETGTGSAIHWPGYIADAMGIFAKQDIEVEFVPAPSSAAVMQQLAAGSLTLAVSGPGDALRAIDKGAPVTILQIEASAAPYEVFGKPGMKTLADLRGRTVMLGGAKDITRYYLERMLVPFGLKAGDHDMVYAGATSQRFAALQSGSIDATILNAPFNFKARAAGFVSLGLTADTVNDVPFGTITVNRAWALAHRQELARFRAAWAEGVNVFYDRAHRDQVIEIFRNVSKSDPDDAARIYDSYVALRMFDPLGDVAAGGLARLISDLKKDGDLEGSANLSRFYDPALIDGMPEAGGARP